MTCQDKGLENLLQRVRWPQDTEELESRIFYEFVYGGWWGERNKVAGPAAEVTAESNWCAGVAVVSYEKGDRDSSGRCV